jgi:hypothetical protein
MESGGCDLRINNCREASVRRAFLNIKCKLASRSPARLVQYFFSRQDTHQVLFCLRAGSFCCAYFGGEEGTGESELAAGVGVGGVQTGSSARAWRSLAVDRRCESRVSHGGEARSYASCRRRVVAGGARRYGGGGPLDRKTIYGSFSS